MGIVLATLAQRTPVRHGAKSLLLNLSLSASDRTRLWRGSVEALADGSGISRRTAQRNVLRLEGQGLIRVERAAGRGNVSLYRILLGEG